MIWGKKIKNLKLPFFTRNLLPANIHFSVSR